ncbi:tastin isoform X2 [Pongo pygmaeus]|uniref:tastin isoform X2 n=1 Tax=Pongo pygmaeus TaxID=9600 RepID=UPI0023E0E0EB|nr:tastin isoform X3 [Pongo pygmaeus]
MTTRQATKDPLLRGVSPTPSKIPVRSQKRTPFPTVTSCALDQENQDPRRWVQKPPLNIQRPLVDSAGPRPKARHQAETSQRLVGITQPRNPLAELRPSPRGQNVGPGPPAQTEAPGTIEFVADPAALATILSGEGVKSCHLGRQPSLAKRVLVRGSQGGTTQRGQGVRASAYLAPRTPTHRLDPARASCFSRLEGPGPRGRTLCPQRLQALDSHDSHLMPSPAPVAQLLPGHVVPCPSPFGRAQRVPSPGPPTLTSYSVLRRLTVQPKTRFTPMPSTPRVQQAQWLRGVSPQSGSEDPALPWEQVAVRLFDQESCIRSLEGSGKPPVATPSGSHSNRTPSLQEVKIQRIGILQQLLRQEVEGLVGGQCVPLNGGSSLDMVELQPLLTEISRTLNATEHNSGTSHLPGLLKHSGLPKPCLPEECGEPQPCPAAEPGPPGAFCRNESEIPEPSLQEQLEVPEPCPPAEPRPLESCCRSKPETPEPPPQEQLEVPEPCPPAEPRPLESCCRSKPETPEPSPQEQLEVPEPCLSAEPGPPESCCRSEPEIPEPSRHEQLKVPEPCPPAEPGPLQPSTQGQSGPPGPCPRVELGASEPCTLEHRSLESSLPPCCGQWAPATTSLIFSSQHPLCASPPICSLQSLRPPAGQAGLSSLAPRTLALRERLKSCLTAIHCFHEARLDDECAFYTSRAPPSGPTRVCTNPVATLLEWQDALCFIPVGSAAPRGSPS